MQDWIHWARDRVLGSPRTSMAGALLALVLALTWIGPAPVSALATWLRTEWDALGALLDVLDTAWTRLSGSAVVLLLLGMRDRLPWQR